MKWRHTKIGNWFWARFWYRVDWYIGERKLHKWIKYAKKHNMFVDLTEKGGGHEYLKNMDADLRKSRSPLVIFKPYDKWRK